MGIPQENIEPQDDESEDGSYVAGYENVTETMLFQAFAGIFGETKSMTEIATLFNKFKRNLDDLIDG